MTKIILISGIPGMGKTTIGDYLRDNYGFLHVDTEDWAEDHSSLKRHWLERNMRSFMDEALMFSTRIVITWGFEFDPNDQKVLRDLSKIGATFFWFDGNSKAAKEAVERRGDVEEGALEARINRIDKMNLSEFDFKSMNTFDERGQFLPKEMIANLLIDYQ